jgi:membrane-associated protease RseP (regulator of RpoE activity)
MPEWLAWLLGLFAFLLVLIVSIGLHEAGHMGVAKLFKLSVPRFFVGFGKTVWSFKTKNTEYGFKAIPLGGFVIIEDETQPEKSPERGLLSHVAPWKRILVYLAGPAVNLVIGFVILVSMLMFIPRDSVSLGIDTVNTCEAASISGEACEAAKAGLQSGDVLVAANGTRLTNFQELDPILKASNQVTLTILRAGGEQEVTVPLDEHKMGINMAIVATTATFPEALGTMGDLLVANAQALANIPEKIPGIATSIVTGERPVDSPASIVSTGKTYGDVAASTELQVPDKVERLVLYSGLLNIGLFAVNVLPLAPLDGGRILISLMDSVRMLWSRITRKQYKPTGMNVITAMTAVTASMVFVTMGMLILSDFSLIFHGNL